MVGQKLSVTSNSGYGLCQGLKAELGSDRLLGVPLETYIPSEKLAIELGSADENIEIMKAYTIKMQLIILLLRKGNSNRLPN